MFSGRFSLPSAASSLLTQDFRPRSEPNRSSTMANLQSALHCFKFFQVSRLVNDYPLYAPLWPRALADLGNQDETYACTGFTA